MPSNTMRPNPGPALLDERSLTGIAVHLVALATGIVGAGLVYALTDHPFTRTNARNALNWHLSVLVLTVVAFPTFLLGADQVTVGGETTALSLLPGPLDAIVSVVGMLLLALAGISWLLTGVFALVATIQAVFGTPWAYPLAAEFVEADA